MCQQEVKFSYNFFHMCVTGEYWMHFNMCCYDGSMIRATDGCLTSFFYAILWRNSLVSRKHVQLSFCELSEAQDNVLKRGLLEYKNKFNKEMQHKISFSV